MRPPEIGRDDSLVCFERGGGGEVYSGLAARRATSALAYVVSAATTTARNAATFALPPAVVARARSPGSLPITTELVVTAPHTR
jgi:hypothetical protein